MICNVCREVCEPHGTVELMALECAHVFHRACIEDVWRVGNWPRGWCPNKCGDSAEIIHDDPMVESFVADLEEQLQEQLPETSQSSSSGQQNSSSDGALIL